MSTAISVAKSFAIDASDLNGFPSWRRRPAWYTARRAWWMLVAMSASLNWIAWNSPIALPNCLRSFT
jgi:hypothetical protein